MRFRLIQGDLVFTRTGATVGKVAIFNDAIEAIPGAYLIHYRTFIASSLPWYVYRFFQSSEGQRALTRGTRGIGQPNLNAPTIEAIPFPLPPEDEQLRIVMCVNQLLDAVEHQYGSVRKSHAKTESLRSGVLKHAFSGQLVPQDPTDEPASVLLERIRAERNAANTSKPVRRSRKEPVHA